MISFRNSRPHPLPSIALIGLVIAAFGSGISLAQLSDDFTADSGLNASLWTTSSSLLSGLATKFNSVLLTPVLGFGGAGMNLSGVNWSNELAGVQSVANFHPPFTLTTTVTAMEAHGNAYEVFLFSADLSQWLDVSGNLNPGNGSFFGVWVNYNESGLPFLSLGDDLYSDPSTNSQYTLQIFVEATGVATVSLYSSNGAVLGVQSGLNVGTGPFYLILGQREGGPRVPGANVATWKDVFIAPIAPAPVLSPVTWVNGTPTLAWSAVSGATYQVQYTTTLAPAQWIALGPPITATTSMASTTDAPASDSQRFYRVVLLY
jgi:hypothetical protein